MNDRSAGIFPLHPLGYVQHWLVSGLQSIPYTGLIENDDVFRRNAIDYARIQPPGPIELGSKGPFGGPWQFHYSGRNYFLEQSGFWSSPSTVEWYAYTELNSEKPGEVEARVWVAGSVDVWVNGEHVTRFDVPRYMHPDFRLMALPLRRGNNRLCLRLQVAALRDTRFLFGLQFVGSPPIAVCIPSAASFVEPILWLEQVKGDGIDAVVCGAPAPESVEVIFSDGQSVSWPAGERRVSFGPVRPVNFDVRVHCESHTLERHFEIPANRNGLPNGLPVNLQEAHLDYIASSLDDKFVPGVNYSLMPLIARRILGRSSHLDAPLFAVAIQYINDRRDCSDFVLAALLRLVQLGLAMPEEVTQIKRTALDFRYGADEPGADAMCFHTENHRLLFHGCQLMAGLMYPEETFSNSGRPGREHAALGLQRTRTWFDDIEAHGLVEFLSSTYIPITMAALLNVVDFSDDPELARRATAQIDQVFVDLADHAFRGVTVGPQGRVYRNVLCPEEGGTQALLSWATPEALPDFRSGDSKSKERGGDWMVFLATSKSYRPPRELAERMRHPVSRRYTQAGVEIVLHKTPDYILTSLALPRSDGKAGLLPGGAGYQEHLWQATLGHGCHVFVNHPGCSYDGSKLSRPGYWYGNGVLPVVRQNGRVLQSIFDIPDGTPFARKEAPGETGTFGLHPIPFTHVYWPSDLFEQQQFHDQWVFGWKNTGFIGLWCSQRLEPHDDVLTGREMRATGCRSAWAIVCGGLSTDASFATFIESCLARAPQFDREKLVLKMVGEEPLCWPQPSRNVVG